MLVAGVVLGSLLWARAGEDRGLVASVDDPEVRAYLEAVREVEQVRGDVIRELSTVLGGTYSTRPTWLTAVREAVAAMPADALAARARAIAPPPGYEDAHALWLDSLDQATTHLAGMERAVDRGDLLSVVVAMNSMQVDAGRVAIRSPPAFCARLALVDVPRVAEVLCRDRDTLPAGTYGQQLWGVALRVHTEVFPRIALIPPSLSEAETLGLLAIIQPDVERVFAEALAEVESLQPPGALRSDHEAAISYLRGMMAVATDITVAARAGDTEALAELFARSAEPGRDLDRRLSATGRELLRPVLEP